MSRIGVTEFLESIARCDDVTCFYPASRCQHLGPRCSIVEVPIFAGIACYLRAGHAFCNEYPVYVEAVGGVGFAAPLHVPAPLEVGVGGSAGAGVSVGALSLPSLKTSV